MKFVFRIFAFVLCCVLFSGGLLAQANETYNEEVVAKIDLETRNELVYIVGTAINASKLSQSIRYVLSANLVQEDGRRLRNEQSGRLVMEVGQQADLSEITVSAKETARVILLLLIYDEKENIIGKDRIVLNDDESQSQKVSVSDQVQRVVARRNKDGIGSEDVSRSGEDGLELSNLVTDDMKTKPGRDFVTLFYSDYQRYKINSGKYIISLKEVLAIGNNTKIEVRVGNDIVWQFFTRPRYDFLKDQAFEAIKKVYQKLKALKEQKSDVIQKF
ncbi:MAG: CsgE family curli-type amyloid fiber assembly protein [Dokdonia sp.]|jgi:hypothetical protein|nr:hypothetical protein [Cytophagaceae bacterium]